VYPSLEKGQAWLNIYPEYLVSKNSSKYRAKVNGNYFPSECSLDFSDSQRLMPSDVLVVLDH
jgi:hypothetical protein